MFHIWHGAVPQPLCAQKHHHWGEARPRGFRGSPGSSCRGDPLWAEQRRRSRGGLGGHSWVLSFTAMGITCSLLVPRVPGPQSPSQGILQLLGKTFWLCEFLEEETIRAMSDGAGGLVPAPSLACGVPYLPPSLPHQYFISLPLLSNQFPSAPKISAVVFNCIYGAVLGCAASLDYRVVPGS